MQLAAELSADARSVAQRLGSAVVTIGRDGRGSGVVIAAGKVLTNAHNLRDRSTLVTFADGRAVQATVSGADADGDLVVLDVDTGDAAPVEWAAEPPIAGDVVFTVSRGGHRSRVSFGMVSAVDLALHGPRGRQIDGGVEHSAPLARGSSGGPLANAGGQVIGLNTHRAGRGFYLARPIDDALRATLDTLASGRSVSRPRLGVALAPADVAAKLRASVGLPERTGLLVRGVEPGGLAATAGIVEGDLLVSADGAPLDTIDALHNALTNAVEALTLVAVRGTDERTVTVDLASRADEPPAE